ncbi:hypothetical protein Aco03nite_010170 [Actinoplanes couchii]|uniref:Uncharacterized protein n=1 Tax=Actinoplanes couchii TaxID=403638 RepID=A0ABQ3X2A7_9ACTN|nr:hypothetical protein Aco03nite_010170 [Actinoplanes couchii]
MRWAGGKSRQGKTVAGKAVAGKGVAGGVEVRRRSAGRERPPRPFGRRDPGGGAAPGFVMVRLNGDRKGGCQISGSAVPSDRLFTSWFYGARGNAAGSLARS